MTAARIALTGAGGSLAADIIPALIDGGYQVVGVDLHPGTDARVEWIACSIEDRAALGDALAGCSAVIHLAGIPLEAPWEDILRTNINGTQAVLEAAVAAGVPRAVVASSIHATGYTRVPPAGHLLADDIPMRPNTYYGVSKAAVEALGSLFHDRYGMDVVCLRIASRFDAPRDRRMLSTWLSPADAGRLFLAALSTPRPGFVTVWGVSANSRRWTSTAGGDAIGFDPLDDAETFAPVILDTTSADSPGSEFVGGEFSSDEPPMYRNRTTLDEEGR